MVWTHHYHNSFGEALVGLSLPSKEGATTECFSVGVTCHASGSVVNIPSSQFPALIIVNGDK